MTRSWTLAGGLLLLVILVGAALLRRAGGPAPSSIPRAAKLHSVPDAAAPGAVPSKGFAIRPAPPSPPDRPVDPMRVGLRAQGKALAELLRILESKGGAAALHHVRIEVLRPSTSIEDRLVQAFLTRLIAHVAAADPAMTSAALGLSREILQSTVADPWARLQAAAGLGGLSSADALPSIRPGGPPSYHFPLGPPDATLEGPFHASLRDAAREESVLGSSLPAFLVIEKIPAVREALVLAMGEIGAPGAADALRGAALSDPTTGVRRRSLEALERTAAPELGDVARRMARSDADPENQAAALNLLGRTSAADPATTRFLADCLANQEPRDALPALARSAFAALEAGPSTALQDGLSRLLLQKAADPELAEAFAKEAVDRGLSHFLPLLRTMEASLPADAPSRETLARAATQLEDAPRYAALAQRIKGVEKETRTLMEESALASTPEVRRAEIQGRIGALLAELWEAERRLGR